MHYFATVMLATGMQKLACYNCGRNQIIIKQYQNLQKWKPLITIIYKLDQKNEVFCQNLQEQGIAH